MIKKYNEFINEGLLPGKSKKDIGEIFKNMSYDDIFYKIDNLFSNRELNGSTLDEMNKLKSINYDNVFIFEIISESWDSSFNLEVYGICGLNKECIINKLQDSLIVASKNYFDDKEDLDDHKILIQTTLEYVDNNTLCQPIMELTPESEQMINMYYKVDGVVHTLDYKDKILKYVK